MSTPTGGAIVVGGGIIGGSIAWRLAQAGTEVTVLDAGSLGGEASWAGAGMLAPGGEFVARSRWAEFAMESLALYPAFVRELEAESSVAIDYVTCGALEFARTEAERQELQERRAAQASLGIRWEDREQAVYYPDDALVDPRDVMRALRAALERRQVRIAEQTRVLSIRPAADRVEIETVRGTLSASAAVLAAGAWSGQLPVEGVEIPPSFPVRGHLLGYTLEPRSVGPILRHGHTYVMQRSSGFTIAGTSSEQVGFNREIDPRIVAEIHARACELLPRLRSLPEPRPWLGFRPAAAGFEPVIRQLPGTALWLAYGHYRNGILLAPATAARVAGEIIASWERDSSASGGRR